ncbi:MAG: accessory Sec system glycosyltransferase Asp1 [Streptococcaceae bacterium]|jgi:poly(glycerol-phosphate) alpha-glucosyltransferase|nr:accessory Sec system glycosyltransferase Asp1 [Streptococcaceae bacterium]
MNYFLNENIFTLNSGTEFSALKRLELFKAHGIPAKILTRNYSSQLRGDAGRVGLLQTDVMNMYDFFQETVEVPEADIDVRYAEAIDKNTYHIEGIDANRSVVRHAGKVIAEVQIAPATVGIVGSIDYYNDLMGISAKDIWDRRGFKSSTQYFHPDGTPGAQLFFDRTGKPRLEIARMNVNGQVLPSMYKVLDYKGKSWQFDSEDQLFVFFLNELAAREDAVFINDRPSLAPAFSMVQGARGKWQFLHATHAANGAPKQVAPYMKPIFDSLAVHFDGVLVPTEAQQADIYALGSKFKNVLVVPDTFSEVDKPVSADKRTPDKLVYLGRMADDKNTSEVIKIFAKIHQKRPNARLKFLGYASPADSQQKIEELATKEKVRDFIEFAGYVNPAVYKAELESAALALSTSVGEAFGMTVLDALSAGVPVVAYDVKYGLREQIENGVNGALVQLGASQKAADAALAILDDLAHYSTGAYEKAKTFDADNAWEKWQAAHAFAGNLFVD